MILLKFNKLQNRKESGEVMDFRFQWDFRNFLFSWAFAKRKEGPKLTVVMICFGFLTVFIDERINVKEERQ